LLEQSYRKQGVWLKGLTPVECNAWALTQI
jgi:hypothetical protein